MAVRTVSVALKAQVGDLVSGFGTAVRATKGFNEELAKLGREAPHKLNDITMAAGGMGLALLTAAGYAVKASTQFDKQMSEVGAVADATGQELGKLREAALAAGAATAYSATEAAKAEAELAKAGLSTSQILGGALTGALSLAAAGSLDLAEAADVAAKTMNVFQLSGRDVGHIADVLSAAANKSATDVHELGQALKMGGLAANAAGITLEETVGTLAAFADHALVGSDAGTSLKTMLMMLQAPTEKSANLMHDLGIEAYDTGGTFVGVAKLADELQTSLGGMTQEQRNAALATIFGADAMRAANILYEQGARGIREYTEDVNDQGAAAEVAAKKLDNLAGDLERLRGSIETLAIDSGSGASGGLRKLVQGLDSVVDSASALPASLQTGLVVLGGVGGAALLAGAGLLKAKQATDEALRSMSEMGPTGARASRALSVMASSATRLGVAAIALQTFSAAWAAFGSDPSAEALKIPRLAKDLEEFANSGKVAGEAAKNFGRDLELLKYDLGTLDTSGGAKFGNWLAGTVEGLTGLGNVADESLVHAKQRLGELDSALAQMVTSGNAEEAQKAFDRIAEAAKKQGVSIDELKAGLPQYVAAMADADAVQLKGIEVNERNNQSLIMMNSSLRAVISSLGSFQAAWEQFNGGAISMSEAQIAVEDALDGLDEQLDKHNAKLNASKTGYDLNTQAGRDAQQMLNEVAKSAAAAAQATYEQTGSVDQAAATFESYKQRLIETLDQSGLTRAEAEALAEQYMQMPKTVLTNVQLYGTDNAEEQIRLLKESLERVPGSKTININVRANLPPGISMGMLMHQADGGVVEFYAAGGVRDPNRVAQIAPAGAWRVWAEPETKGEAYIPFAESKRGRSIQILTETDARLGYPLTQRAIANQGPYDGILAAGGNRFTAWPTPMSASAAPAAAATVSDVRAMAREMVAALSGGVKVYLNGTLVGQGQGREADLLRRGG